MVWAKLLHKPIHENREKNEPTAYMKAWNCFRLNEPGQAIIFSFRGGTQMDKELG
jgi:hypothetical protein